MAAPLRRSDADERHAIRVNILLVDDQPAKLLSYEVDPRRARREPDQGRLGARGAGALLKNDVAVVLIDVCMPELDGFELAAMIREHPRFQKTAIIFVSAIQLTDLDRLRGYETGAVDYVPVPVVPEILRAKVQVFAELYRKTRQLEQLNAELERRVAERTARARGIDRPVARDRRAAAAGQRGRGLRHLRLPCGHRPGVLVARILRELAASRADAPFTLETALAAFHPDHRETVRQPHSTATRRAGRREIEFKVVRPDGEIRWLLDRGQACPTSMASRHARDAGPCSTSPSASATRSASAC